MEITNIHIGSKDGTTRLIEYNNLTEADSSPQAVELVEFADRSVQVVGTFNGGTVAIQGSNNGVDWATLTDPQGNSLSVTSARLEQIQELTRYIRPSLTGTGMDIDVFFLVRRASSIRN